MIDPMFSDSIRALAAIDKELGMPEDGCNSTQATLVAIRLLKAAHADDAAEIERLQLALRQIYTGAAEPVDGLTYREIAEIADKALRGAAATTEVAP